jgi:hypothetical protein
MRLPAALWLVSPDVTLPNLKKELCRIAHVTEQHLFPAAVTLPNAKKELCRVAPGESEVA